MKKVLISNKLISLNESEILIFIKKETNSFKRKKGLSIEDQGKYYSLESKENLKNIYYSLGRKQKNSSNKESAFTAAAVAA